MRSFIAALVAFAGMAASHAQAPDDVVALADGCMGCHGIAGYRNAYPSYRVPKLGGQHADYIVISLKAYREGMRHHPTMQAQAADLSDEEMAELAAYLVSMESEPESGIRNGGDPAAGAVKAETCTACHGETGVSLQAMWPNLAGQHEDYIAETLRQYKRGERQDPVMAGLVMALTEEDIKDLAAFYAAQPGLHTIEYDN